MGIASKRNSSGDGSLRNLVLPIILIFLLSLGTVSEAVYATGNGVGKDNGSHGRDKSGGHHGDRSSDGRGDIDSNPRVNKNRDDRGNRKETDSGNRNNEDHGGRKSNGHDSGRGRNADGKERMVNVNEEHDQKSISDVGGKTTTVVQHTDSMHAAQSSVVVLLVASETTSSVGAAWWSLVESNAERLFRKFSFLAGCVGERIRRENVFKNRKRREIYSLVVNNPFSHFRMITRMAGVGPNEGSWHLRILEKMGLIESEHIGRYLTYHANNSSQICRPDNQLICLMRNSNATKILMYLVRNPGVTIAHLTQALMINRNTISYHVKQMRVSGLIERVGMNGLRLSPIVGNHGETLAHFIANPVTSKNLMMHPKAMPSVPVGLAVLSS